MTLLSVASRLIPRATQGIPTRFAAPLGTCASSIFLSTQNLTQNETATPSSYSKMLKTSFHASASIYEDSGSHSDFAAKRKSVDGDDVQKLIHVSHPIYISIFLTEIRFSLYNKGTCDK